MVEMFECEINRLTFNWKAISQQKWFDNNTVQKVNIFYSQQQIPFIAWRQHLYYVHNSNI